MVLGVRCSYNHKVLLKFSSTKIYENSISFQVKCYIIVNSEQIYLMQRKPLLACIFTAASLNYLYLTVYKVILHFIVFLCGYFYILRSVEFPELVFCFVLCI